MMQNTAKCGLVLSSKHLRPSLMKSEHNPDLRDEGRVSTPHWMQNGLSQFQPVPDGLSSPQKRFGQIVD